MDAEALRATNHAKDTLCKAPTKELQDEFWDHQEACKAPKVQLYSRYANHDFTLKFVSGKEERIFRGNSRFLLAAIFILKQEWFCQDTMFFIKGNSTCLKGLHRHFKYFVRGKNCRMSRTDEGFPCKLAVFNPVTGAKYLFVDENALYFCSGIVLRRKTMMEMAATLVYTQTIWRLLECINECFIAILVLHNCSHEV